MRINLFFCISLFLCVNDLQGSEKSGIFASEMSDLVPNIILRDAKSNGYSNVLFGGEFDGVSYFVYVRPYQMRYSGLPCVVKLDGNNIVDVVDIFENGRAFSFAMQEQQSPFSIDSFILILSTLMLSRNLY